MFKMSKVYDIFSTILGLPVWVWSQKLIFSKVKDVKQTDVYYKQTDNQAKYT